MKIRNKTQHRIQINKVKDTIWGWNKNKDEGLNKKELKDYNIIKYK